MSIQRQNYINLVDERGNYTQVQGQGQKGQTGAQGDKGASGQKGDTGSQGPKGTAGTNNITIEPNGSEKIDRQLNMIIAANSGSVILFCDGTEYFIAGTR